MKAALRYYLSKLIGISQNDLSLLRNGHGVVVPETPESEIENLISKIRPINVSSVPLIRLGPNSDGGYLVPNDLEGISACFSPGVDKISGFEKSCADLGMKVFMADRSVDHPADKHDSFNFIKKHLGSFNNENTITLASWVSNSLEDVTADLLLQMDIEGSEYETILHATDELLKRFRIITVEFHGIDEWVNPNFFKIVSHTFHKLLLNHHCVHIHPNNCLDQIRYKSLRLPRLLEFTFLRKDRVGHFSPASDFPHPLDCDNTPNTSLVLPREWYASK
jgi:hypothetical protein